MSDALTAAARPATRALRPAFHRRPAVLATNLLLVASILALPACGGGGSDDPQAQADTQDQAQADPQVEALTAEDLTVAAALARSEGQLELADALTQMAGKLSGQTATDKSIWSSIAKKALISALRHGGKALGKLVAKMSPKAGKAMVKHANRIADMLETLQKMQEIPIIMALVHMGIEPTVAREIARWIVIFIGV